MSDSDSQPSPRPESGKDRTSSDDEAVRAIRDVLRDQAEREARKKKAAKRKEKKRLLPLPVVALLWGVACLVVWAATPEFLLPEPLPEPTPAEVETGLRMEMISMVAEVESYREQTGRVPEALERVVERPPVGVRYTRLSSESYRMTGERGDTEIIYQSGDPVDDLVGDVRRQIRGGSEASP